MSEKNSQLNTNDKSLTVTHIYDDSKLNITKGQNSLIEKSLSINHNKSLNQTLYSQASYNNPESLPTKNNQILIYGNDIENKKPKKMGKTKVYFFYNNYPLISIGPEIFYPIICLTFIIFIYISFIIFFNEKSGKALNFLHHLTFIIYLLCHIIAIIINPGIPSYEYSNLNKEMVIKSQVNDSINILDYHICKNCNCCFKIKDKVNHCSKCNICYLKFDHHCKWIGHCVAKNNKIFFYCFATSIWIFGLVCFGILFVNILIKFFKINNL
jgi:hypothetical protein